MRLRNRMAPSDVEHQLKFIVYTLERASELADDAGREPTCHKLPSLCFKQMKSSAENPRQSHAQMLTRPSACVHTKRNVSLCLCAPEEYRVLCRRWQNVMAFGNGRLLTQKLAAICSHQAVNQCVTESLPRAVGSCCCCPAPLHFQAGVECLVPFP